MSVLGNIISAIFHPGAKPAVVANANANATVAPPENSAPAANKPQVDVVAELTQMASQTGQKLNWQTSIVDLMKLLKLDSGLESRKELAKELGYNESTDDTAKMNTWLIGQVMTKLAANGGKVPKELMH